MFQKEMAKSGGVLYQSATSPCTGWVEVRWLYEQGVTNVYFGTIRVLFAEAEVR